MEKHHYKIPILIFTLVAAIAVILLSQKMQKTESESYTPSLAEAEEVFLETSVISPDGKMSLNLKKEEVESGIKYTFFVKEMTSGIETEVFYKTVPTGENISIPANTFSPDNKYVFLKEEGVVQANYFVLSVDQSPNSLKILNPLNFSDLFNQKYDNYKITDVTGWGGINLIVVNTNGPSFWFEVPSKAFIQLSNRFD